MCEFSEALIEQGVTKAAHNMLRKDTPIDMVVEFTGLPKDKAEAIAKQIE